MEKALSSDNVSFDIIKFLIENDAKNIQVNKAKIQLKILIIFLNLFLQSLWKQEESFSHSSLLDVARKKEDERIFPYLINVIQEYLLFLLKQQERIVTKYDREKSKQTDFDIAAIIDKLGLENFILFLE